ncbi:MAG TPA: proteasome activator [Acidimicrobiales bacterium]|nr:proteasome activator [Acidimicrobiales bacterium]
MDSTVRRPGRRNRTDFPAQRGRNPLVGRDDESESVQPAKLVRIEAMLKHLLDEVRDCPLDEPSRTRLREIQELSLHELASAVSPNLADELARVSSPFGQSAPSLSELRIAQAQLVGWLEGLFHGIQAAVMAQQIEAEEERYSRQRDLATRSVADSHESKKGNYL